MYISYINNKMEEDYILFSKEKEQLLDELGIDYVWRDSCVDMLIETKRCMKSDFKSGLPILNKLSICKGIQDLWKDCEKKREIKLHDSYFLKFKYIEETIKKKGENK